MLDSKNLGFESRILRGDKSFLGDKASALQRGGMWQRGLAFVKDTYKMSDDEATRKSLFEVDDWAMWQLLIEATRNIDTPG